MASKLIKGSSVKNIYRGLAAQASASAQQHSYPLPQQQPQVVKLPNGEVVATLENNSPISHISILVKAGSRHECPDALGTSHMTRLCAGLATKNFTAFGVARRMPQMGATLTCESGREYMAYSLTCNRDNIYAGFEILADVAMRSCFKPWEVDSVQSRLQAELASQPPVMVVSELLHAAAFRNSPLGHSITIPDYRVGKVTPDELHEFVKGTHTSGRVAYVGLGVEHVDFFKLARDNGLAPMGPGAASVPAAFGGGEIRRDDGSCTAYVALAASGAKLDSEEALALSVAQFALGSPPATKYGTNPLDKLHDIAAKAGGSGRIVPINLQYSDGGLFGVLIQESASTAGEVVRAVSKGMRTLKLTDADVQSAKKRAKSAILMAMESSGAEAEEMGQQILFTGKYTPRDQVVAAIDKISAAAVQSALTNAVKGKASMAALGGISKVPYLDQL